MKKMCLMAITAVFLFCGCTTAKLAENEELVEYKPLWEGKNLETLTEAQLKEDCEALKYLLYNAYAGINEAIEKGLDLDAQCDLIYTNMLKKKDAKGCYLTSDLASEMRKTISDGMNLNDQHIRMGTGGLKTSTCLYYSEIFFNKDDDKYTVIKSNNDEIKEGMLYTGPGERMFETYLDEKIAYRYGIFTNKSPASAMCPIENKNYIVTVKADKPIPSKAYWTGLKTTDKTMYFSLSDCMFPFGLKDSGKYSMELLYQNLTKIARASKNKEILIFDLRSNGGGYEEYPAKMYAAALYGNHYDDKDFIQNIEALYFNSVNKDVQQIISPFTMQKKKILYEKDWKTLFSLLTPENQEFCRQYWKKMHYLPIRKFTAERQYACTFDTFPEPDFKGDLYILINSYTGSAAELGTAMAFLLQDQGVNVKIVGENSWGGVEYVGVWGMQLPNSGIWLNLPSTVGLAPVFDSIPEFKGEGYGFYPDYWATNDTILQVLINLTGDKELETVLKGLDKGML